MALVPAYDKTTGKKLPQYVPEHWIGHPALGPNLSVTPRAKQRAGKPATGGETDKPADQAETDKE